MNGLTRARKVAFVAITALAIVLAVNVPGRARGMGGPGFGGDHPGAVHGHHGFDGHPGFHGGFGFRPGYPYFPYYGYYPPAYGYAAPGYWYYCRSYGAYYPSVESCPEEWVPVPAS